MSNAVLHQFVYTLSFALKSDGDSPVNISGVTPSALYGVVSLKSSTCNGEINVGDECSITVTYDPTAFTSSTGLVADTLRIDLTSDAGEPHDFVQALKVVLASKEN